MSSADFLVDPVAPGLYQLDEATLVSVRTTRSAQDPCRYRAVALAALRNSHRVLLHAAVTVGYGPDRENALQACLDKVRESLDKKPFLPIPRTGRRPEASL
jgi:hypothetical protein